MGSSVCIMVIGSANTDMVVKVPSIPAPGETLLGQDFAMVAGGKGANQAVAAARLGARVRFVGCVGDDLFGSRTRQVLEAEGINLDGLSVDSTRHSGVALIAVDASGQNAIAVAPGANMAVLPEHVDRAFSDSAGVGCVVLQCEIPIGTVAHAIHVAHAQGIPVMLNPAPATALPNGLLQGVICVTPNETEATALTGIEVNDHRTAQAAAKRLIKQGALSVVVTLGHRGAVAATPDGTAVIEPLSVDAVDATAAGDCFTAALAVALLRPGPRAANAPVALAELVDACRFASAAAALSVMRLGAQPSLPTVRELEKFIKARSDKGRTGRAHGKSR